MKTSITVADGKYTVEHEDGAGICALRYGEEWRDLVGDGLVLALVQRIEELEGNMGKALNERLGPYILAGSRMSISKAFEHGWLSNSPDAERYRWLRECNWHDSDLAVVCNPKFSIKLGIDCPSLERLDEMIDKYRGVK
jgi:hypothetical protein